MNQDSGLPRPDLTDGQVGLLIDTFEMEATKIGELLDALRSYAAAGGRDWESYERFMDHVARSGMRMVMAGRSAIHPDSPERAAALVGHKSPGLKGQVHHSLSTSVLCGIWAVGEHHLIDIEDWSSQLPGIVRTAVEQASRINEDPGLPLGSKG